MVKESQNILLYLLALLMALKSVSMLFILMGVFELGCWPENVNRAPSLACF
jgi:hypothetical protein